MNIVFVLTGTLVVVGISFLLSLIISLISQMFTAKTDPLVEKIYDVLPHFNCGACGYPGCKPYAEAIVGKSEVCNKCRPGREPVAQKIADLLAQNKPE
ncbi:MAG: RnfABCDGE type electron transport complex subunit B [Brevinemataceae bacterium]